VRSSSKRCSCGRSARPGKGETGARLPRRKVLEDEQPTGLSVAALHGLATLEGVLDQVACRQPRRGEVVELTKEFGPGQGGGLDKLGLCTGSAKTACTSKTVRTSRTWSFEGSLQDGFRRPTRDERSVRLLYRAVTSAPLAASYCEIPLSMPSRAAKMVSS
jgi:hypothetical protein